MNSKEIPDNGLMEGEPGSLYFTNDPPPERYKKGDPRLELELYLDEPQFEELFANLTANIDKVVKASLGTVIELFESELQAALAEPWMSREFGFLKQERCPFTVTATNAPSISALPPRP